MRPQVLLAALAVIAVLAAALPLAHSQGATLCCDNCGSCTRSIPPQCTCMDTSPTGCNPACKTCSRSTVGGRNSFQCKDRVANFCKTRCTNAA
ncbi:hypothetical protein CFC21_009852 [Triticum aestivum]|uniref:Bowman-Birk trypsin inhibitor-like protein n=5 Tax=Triticinae TaxID=1648030 RepID=A0A9R1DIR7_WHEAT|nr:Bowman-Birk type trypsin inhibitor [Aegilops tauschii subsp. strangulata]XP_044447720.1 Bowman-Birk type trypsin inhibitor-like [Triticum aestivum]ABX84382.1 Bowman-Birk trypsin inhibitor-like protein [Triticum aestivum]KAF6992898.1 hypothetical protein CFC21_009852 [Triticum aestivum]